MFGYFLDMCQNALKCFFVIFPFNFAPEMFYLNLNFSYFKCYLFIKQFVKRLFDLQKTVAIFFARYIQLNTFEKNTFKIFIRNSRK